MTLKLHNASSPYSLPKFLPFSMWVKFNFISNEIITNDFSYWTIYKILKINSRLIIGKKNVCIDIL